MKIATWNIQRLDKRENQHILDKLINLDADILVLTETNSIIQLDNYTCVSTSLLPIEFDGIKYKVGENRVSILTKYNATTQHKTFDKYTAVCIDIETPFGPLTIYGTIIGVFANRQPRFDCDLNGLITDLNIFSGNQLCVLGDFNTTFSGRVYPSHRARQTLIDTFINFGLTNTTASITDNVDHIVLSNDFLIDKKIEIETWNHDKKLSDHIGVAVEIF